MFDELEKTGRKLLDEALEIAREADRRWREGGDEYDRHLAAEARERAAGIRRRLHELGAHRAA